ncbi:MAG TPA: hypothetical protein VFJ51_05975, partial [Nitrososphaeraceae archaeon]|nr:hypothetical protein [Nitrososphaeraceae archaeon]
RRFLILQTLTNHPRPLIVVLSLLAINLCQVLMVCRNICKRLYSKIIVGKSPYQDGKRYCRRCEVYFCQVERFCLCCGMTLRTSPAGKKLREMSIGQNRNE